MSRNDSIHTIVIVVIIIIIIIIIIIMNVHVLLAMKLRAENVVQS